MMALCSPGFLGSERDAAAGCRWVAASDRRRAQPNMPRRRNTISPLRPSKGRTSPSAAARKVSYWATTLETAVESGSPALGVIAALYRDKWPDQVIRVFSIAGLATPSFWLAVLLILLFSSYLKVLPASGALPHFTTNPAGYLGRMIMPAIALAFPLTGQMTRIVRTAMVEELDKDYVRMARGAGVPEKVVVGINVLRNALITPVTTLGLKIGYLMGGAVVIEVIFNLPGMGTAILQGVQGNEANLVQGVVIVVALAFIIINIVVDMLYLLINPRIRTV